MEAVLAVMEETPAPMKEFPAHGGKTRFFVRDSRRRMEDTLAITV
jgi:hypothetical protein